MNEAQINKQHPIPQNFMDVEFKIVGDFTVRQFTYLCATGLPMYFIFNSPIQGFIKTVLLILLGLLGFLLVFVPIDDRGMDVWIVNFFKSVYGINRRVWRKTPIIPKTLSMETIKLVQGEMITLAPTSSRRKLEEYLKGIKVEEADEYDFDFKKHRFDELEPLPQMISISEVEIKPEVQKFDLEKEIQKEMEKPLAVSIEAKTSTEVKLEKPAVQEVVIKLPQVSKETPKEEPAPREAFHKELLKKVSQPIRVMPTSLREVIKPKPKLEIKKDVHEDLRTSTLEVPGRKFVSFSAKEQDIILPIRGEKNINIFQQQTTPQPSGAKDIKTLTKELRTLVREIKNEEPNITNTPPKVEVIDENKISGICFDETNKPLSNILLTLLDSNDKEVQYSRTDTLGKFNFNNTSLGDYKIKVLNPEIYSLNFDIIKFSVRRYPYSLIQIVGKK